MILGIFLKLKTSSFGKSAGFRYTYTYIKKFFWTCVSPMYSPNWKLHISPLKFFTKNVCYVQQPGMMGVRPMGMQPAMGMQQPIGMQPAMGMQQPMVFGMQPAMGNMMSQPRPPAQTNQDPFGALWDSISNHNSGKYKKIYRSLSLLVFNRSPWGKNIAETKYVLVIYWCKWQLCLMLQWT